MIFEGREDKIDFLHILFFEKKMRVFFVRSHSIFLEKKNRENLNEWVNLKHQSMELQRSARALSLAHAQN